MSYYVNCRENMEKMIKKIRGFEKYIVHIE